ncbi:IcmT/TraK family protein [Aureimonas pseudogalii]|uniref:Uncharacterized protein n=1 Tax=Aureimonas pseudogalii TaxID=1744844 RepID=A0A7W6H7M0_9HYPH|nr:IcmT/TraK family protein [Aureimonas pseudogalii]MBB4000098.1 hypothetical protein [Aureimonas pseudogalii]
MEKDDGLFGKPIEWRYTMKNPRLAIFDARLIFFVVLLFLHLRVWTALLLFIGILLFWAMERYGYRFSSSIRGIRARLAGPIRPARPLSRYRHAIDFGFEDHPILGDRGTRKLPQPAPVKVKKGAEAPLPSPSPAE